MKKETMRALRFHGNKDIRVDEIPVPLLRPGWVRIKNAFAGICGSDLHEYLVGPKTVPTQPHVLTGEKLPTVCGHEFSGIIEEIGQGVEGLKVGQKVAVFPILSDGVCKWCETETYGLCPKWGFLGYSGYGGGMAEYVCVDSHAIHYLPENVSLEVGALVEPLAVAWHAVEVAKADPSDYCLVVGAGPIGIAVVHCLLAHGVRRIMVSEPSSGRARAAREAGAHYVFDPLKEDVPGRCYEIAEGVGAQITFDCAGVQAGFDMCLACVRGKGTIVNVGLYEKPLVIQTPNKLNRWSLTYVGSNVYTRKEFQAVIDAISSGLIKRPETMITARVPLTKAVTDGFENLLAHKDEHIKILIDATC